MSDKDTPMTDAILDDAAEMHPSTALSVRLKYYASVTNELANLSRTLERDLTAARQRAESAEQANDRALSVLESYGVPRERARSVDNGSMVLVQRFNKAEHAWSAEKNTLAAEKDELAGQVAKSAMVSLLAADAVEKYFGNRVGENVFNAMTALRTALAATSSEKWLAGKIAEEREECAKECDGLAMTGPSPIGPLHGAGYDAGRAAQRAAMVPDGYAVVMADGHFVGIWQTEGAAKLMRGRDPRSKGETIRPMTYALPPEKDKQT